MNMFLNKNGKAVLMQMVKAIQDNKDYLGEVDGLIGDGDHGMNMNKGFTLFETRFNDKNISFSQGLFELGNILFSEIGGSMGPIYGTIFMDASNDCEDIEQIDLNRLAIMLRNGLTGLKEIVEANIGDKTLVDTLEPAVISLEESVKKDVDFKFALELMKLAAEEGKNSTKDMVAKFGRSSRLGERSRGVLDAGATSCCIILTSMADGIIKLL